MRDYLGKRPDGSHYAMTRWSADLRGNADYMSYITAEKALTKLGDEGVIHSVISKGYYISGS